MEDPNSLLKLGNNPLMICLLYVVTMLKLELLVMRSIWSHKSDFHHDLANVLVGSIMANLM